MSYGEFAKVASAALFVAALSACGANTTTPSTSPLAANTQASRAQAVASEAGPDTKAIFNTYSFTGLSDGGYPYAGLYEDANQIIYGTTVDGGANTVGTVFELVPPDYTKENVLYAFAGTINGNSDGAYPRSTLIGDSSGVLYGTTSRGGPSPACHSKLGCGTVFSLTPSSSGNYTESILYTFRGNQKSNSDGEFPFAGLVEDAQGILYGTTSEGGVDNCTGHFGCGTVYSLTPNGSGAYIENVVYAFQNGNDGAIPKAALIDVDGTLYGTTTGGGAYGSGVVFALTTSGSLTWVHAFQGGTDGAVPEGPLLDLAGTLYGTTSKGGTVSCGADNCGTIFEIGTSGSGYKVLYNFAGGKKDGANPWSGFVASRNGTLYGTTREGGGGSCTANGGIVVGCGTLFKIKSSGEGYRRMYSFQGAAQNDGAFPFDGLILDKSHNLHGSAAGGGPPNPNCPGDPVDGCGITFEFEPG